MRSEAPLYQTFSFFAAARCLLARALAAAGAAYCVWQFSENPPLLGVLAALCVLVFLLVGEVVVRVYPDRLVLRSNSIASWLWKGKARCYSFEGLKEASLEPKGAEAAPNALEAAAIVTLAALVPATRTRPKYGTPLYLYREEGTEEELHLDVSEGDAARIVALINRQLAEAAPSRGSRGATTKRKYGCG